MPVIPTLRRLKQESFCEARLQKVVNSKQTQYKVKLHLKTERKTGREEEGRDRGMCERKGKEKMTANAVKMSVKMSLSTWLVYAVQLLVPPRCSV